MTVSHVTILDEVSLPQHRTPVTRPSALVTPSNCIPVVSKRRGLLRSSSSNDHPKIQLPQRKRSVRFEGVDSQLDGTTSHSQQRSVTLPTNAATYHGSNASKSTETSAEHSEPLPAANGTVVRRSSSKTKPTVPFINSDTDTLPGREYSESATSSSPVAHDPQFNWSPVSTASTGATSWTSPSSSGSRYKRNTPEDC